MALLPMTKSAAEDLIADYGNKIDSMSSTEIINNITYQIEAKANELEQVALSAYAAFGIDGGSLEEVENKISQKILDLNKDTINLSGINLEETFMKAFRKAPVYNENTALRSQEEYNQFLEYIRTTYENEIGGNMDKFAAIAASVLFDDFGNAGKYTVKSGTSEIRKGKFIGNFSEIFLDLGKKLQSQFDIWAKNHPNIINCKTNTVINGDGSQTTVTWTTYPAETFLKMTADKRKEFFERHPEAKEQILQEFKIQIMNSYTGLEEHKRYFEMAIDQVFFNEINEDAMFGLTNLNLIGRLGEIQSLYYLLCLTDGKGTWVGGLNNPHADLTFEGFFKDEMVKFGIQVKNTTRDVTDYSVFFKNFSTSSSNGNSAYSAARDIETNLTTMIRSDFTSDAISSFNMMSSSLFGSTGIFPNQNNMLDIASSIFGMYGFNVEYGWSDTRPRVYKEQSNPDFHPVRNRIEDLTNKLNRILSIMSSSVMYMQQADQMQQDSNTIYIIGGTTIISAATILHQIAKELRSEVSYKDSSFKFSSSNSSTIVNVLNDKKSISSLNMGLQSSYTFIKK